MTDDLHYPAPLRELLEVQATVQSSATRMLRRHNQFGFAVPVEFDKQLRRYIHVRGEMNTNGSWVAQDDAARSLMENFDELIAVLEDLLCAMEPIFAQADLHPELASLRFSTEVELKKLAFISSLVSMMTYVHVRMQRHLSLLVGEYVFGERSHENNGYWTTVTWSFYRPLTEARDAFFEQPTLETLNRYLSATDNLLELEHPLARDLDGVHVKRSEQAVEQAADVYAELVTDALMFELLEADRD